MQVEINYRGNKKFEANARGHVVIADQPFDEEGRDSGMTPPELFLAAIGSCAAHYAAEYLNFRGLDTSDLRIRISGVKSLHPARLSEITIEVITDNLNLRHKEGLVRAVQHCVLENTLVYPPSVNVEIVGAAEAAELVPMPV